MSILPSSDDPIRTHDDLLAVFYEAAASPGPARVGPEMEKCGVHPADFSPVTYEGEVMNVLVDLAAHHGWKTDRERDGGPVIALEKNGASVTLEPGGQLELSGAPAHDVHGIERETREHMRELAGISDRLGVRWLGIGFHPFAARQDLHWVPKARYATMRDYFPKVGKYGVDMMLRTCTVQANLDYTSEEDAMRKMRLSLAIGPLTTAMFANSPYLEGKPFGGVTMRGLVWTSVDDSRSGLLPALWRKSARFDDYVAWALRAPMFILKREGDAISATDQTFEDFLTHGRDGIQATQADWRLHLNTLFPEVRLKRTIEIRAADAQSPPTAYALPALYAGLFYDARAEDELDALVEPWTFDEVAALRGELWKTGLATPFAGKTLAPIAEKVIDIARGGLQRRARKDAQGRDETIYLDALASLSARGKTPAEDLMDKIGTGSDAKKKLVELTDLAALQG
ncbi:MAG TPA: glutamate-cysteine ligase family protein [Polyangiaceae bacterium]